MTDNAPSKPRHFARQAAIWILKIAVSSVLLYFVLRRNFGPTVAATRNASIPWLGRSR